MKQMFALLVVVLSALVWVWSSNREHAPSRSVETHSRETTSSADAPPIERSPLPVTSSAVRAALEVRHPETAAPDPEPIIENDVDTSQSFVIAIVEVDATGVEHRDRTGTFDFLGSAEEGAFTFVGGRSSVRLSPGQHWSLHNLLIEGRRASILCEAQDRLFSGEPLIEVRARRWPETILHVVDATTKAELSDIELVTTDSDVSPNPSLDRVPIASSRESPIKVTADPADTYGSYVAPHVRAAGHAWNRVFLDLRLGGEHSVELVAGGDAAISVSGLDSVHRYSLAISSIDDEAVFPISTRPLQADGVVQIDSLPTGRMRAIVRLGEWFDRSPIDLAGVEINVPPGGSAHGSISVPTLPAAAEAELSGTLTTDPAWEVWRPSMLIERVDPTMLKVPPEVEVIRSYELGEGLSCTWTAGPVEIGTYVIRVFRQGGPTLLSNVVDVGPTGIHDLALVVGPPVEVKIRIVDGETGSDAGLAALHYSFGSTSPCGQDAKRDDASTTYSVRVPTGALAVSWRGGDFEDGAQDIVVSEASREFVLAAARKTRVVIAFADGGPGLDLRAGFEWEDLISIDDEEAHSGFAESTSNTIALECSARGHYRVSGLRIPGYEIVPDFEVAAVAHRTVQQVIRLVPVH